MINQWTVAYAVLALALLAAIYQARRSGLRLRWLRLVRWLVSAAFIAVIIWSVLACSLLPFLGGLARPSSIAAWGFCVAGASIWAAMAAAFALPFYFLLLAWTVLRRASQHKDSSSAVVTCLLLGLPVFITLLYGYSTPFYAEVGTILRDSVPLAICGWLAASVGLLIPRLSYPGLKQGQFTHDNSA